MTFGWTARDRLAPLRMVDVGHDYPKHEIAKLRRPDVRRHVFDLKRSTLVDDDRYVRRNYPRFDMGGQRKARRKK